MKSNHCDVIRSPRNAVLRQGIDSHTHLIGVAVFDGFSMLPAVEVIDVFDKANQVLAATHADMSCYRTVFVSIHGGRVSSSARVDVLTQKIDHLGKARALFFANDKAGLNTAHDSELIQRLRAATADPYDLIAMTDGSAPSSSASILCSSFRHEEVVTQIDASIDGMAGIATHSHAKRSAVAHALELIRQDFGVALQRRVIELCSNNTALPELPAITRDNCKSIRRKIHESAQWITSNCNRPISVTLAAQTAGMSDRSYLRHFREQMGVKPSEYLRHSRIGLATTMLETTDLPVDKIARRCGLTSGESLARLFREVLGIAPTEYRSRLRAI